MSDEERVELPGQTLDGRYRIERRIGLGGTGVVFEATNLRDGGKLAVKTLRPCFVDHPDLGRRLRREAEVARRVRHPGVVPTLDEGTLSDGSPYIVMPLLKGMTLADALKANPLPPLPATARIGREMAEGLAAAHARGLVHRDIKPGNVWLEGARLRVKVLDFGLARAAGGSDGGQPGVGTDSPAEAEPIR